MAQEPLPSEVDVVVLGTGMPESIIAAACARIGLSVLHLDKHDYYGGLWTSFNLEGIQTWANNQIGQETQPQVDHEQFASFAQEGERVVCCLEDHSAIVENVSSLWHVERAPVKEPTPEVVAQTSGDAENEEITQNSDEKPEEQDEQPATETETTAETEEKQEKEVWTRDRVEKDWRRFSLDITPKLLQARGSLVQLLISSGVGRYAEFKCCNRFLCQYEGELKEVPCSRADVFQNKEITMIEKRKLMKFLNLCLNYETTERDQYEGFEDKPFREFLASQQMSEKLQTFICQAIAMLPTDANTLQGLENTRKFLLSVGRYGNSPLLWTLYGSGELPQCFCRLCAVFGGIYCLRRPVQAWIINEENRCVAIVSEGQRINCSIIVAEPSYVPKQFQSSTASQTRVQRGLFVTDRSLAPAEKEHLTIMNHFDLQTQPVRMLELGHSALVCPKDLYIIQLTSVGTETAQERFWPVAQQFLQTATEVDENEAKPQLLWSLFFDYVQESCETDYHNLPTNIGVTSLPDASLDYATLVEKTKSLFERLWPDSEFLPELEPEEETPPANDPGINGFTPDP